MEVLKSLSGIIVLKQGYTKASAQNLPNLKYAIYTPIVDATDFNKL